MAHDQGIDSLEYEWESLSDVSFEVGMDVMHAYITQPNIVDESRIGSDELDSQFSLVNHADVSRSCPNLDSFGSFSIISTSDVTKYESFHIKNLQASTSFSLLHSNLIDWSTQHK